MSLGPVDYLWYLAVIYFTNPLENIINLKPSFRQRRLPITDLNEVYLVTSEFEERKQSQI